MHDTCIHKFTKSVSMRTWMNECICMQVCVCVHAWVFTISSSKYPFCLSRILHHHNVQVSPHTHCQIQSHASIDMRLCKPSLSSWATINMHGFPHISSIHQRFLWMVCHHVPLCVYEGERQLFIMRLKPQMHHHWCYVPAILCYEA
jgi:hypothetical protein